MKVCIFGNFELGEMRVIAISNLYVIFTLRFLLGTNRTEWPYQLKTPTNYAKKKHPSLHLALTRFINLHTICLDNRTLLLVTKTVACTYACGLQISIQLL